MRQTLKVDRILIRLLIVEIGGNVSLVIMNKIISREQLRNKRTWNRGSGIKISDWHLKMTIEG
jgi:hypothetical protein